MFDVLASAKLYSCAPAKLTKLSILYDESTKLNLRDSTFLNLFKTLILKNESFRAWKELNSQPPDS